MISAVLFIAIMCGFLVAMLATAGAVFGVWWIAKTFFPESNFTETLKDFGFED